MAGIGMQLALREFMRDICPMANKRVKIAAHPLEFDAAIVRWEMFRGGFREDVLRTPKLCTMGRHASKWTRVELLRAMDRDGQGDFNYIAPVALRDLVRTPAPDCTELANTAHEAGNAPACATNCGFGSRIGWAPPSPIVKIPSAGSKVLAQLQA